MTTLPTILTLASAPPAGGHETPSHWWAPLLVPALTLGASALCGVFAALRVKSKLPAVASIGALALSFVAILFTFLNHDHAFTAKAFDWISFDFTNAVGAGGIQQFSASFAFYIDSLTLLWMLFVTGLATLIALYSMEYMHGDAGAGYCRFFAAFNLFVFSMTCLVMADNLLLTFLGWEGVGLCSYLLIGYYYKKPSAVAAAKKAFIMNRIGDLGLVLGVLGCYVAFGTLDYAKIFDFVSKGVDAAGNPLGDGWVVNLIPILLTIGAFGKSAQIFFYVWLPDAMEGPTPVSALIHAATMVTAGVFLISRMYPLFAADPNLTALTFVGWSGAITAFWSATIGMSIFDIKRVMGYSTVSQLGYMFAGLGLLSPVGACFHTFTHAFFKATLFLSVGAVMHGFGGQLDLRRLSGVAWVKGFGVIAAAMLIGAINLAGIPGTAGFFSKDMILAQGFTTPSSTIPGAQAMAWLLLLTAGMTAYYTFRTFFRVFAGPVEFLPGDEQELVDHGRHPKGTSFHEWHQKHGHGDDGHDGHDGHGHHDQPKEPWKPFDPATEDFEPHAPGLAMKAAVGLGALLSIAAAGAYFVGGQHGGWVGKMVHDMLHSSKSHFEPPHDGFNFLGITEHSAMYVISAVVGLAGILIAAYLHGPKGWQGLFIGGRTEALRSRADGVTPMLGGLAVLARNKWFVDEMYGWLICRPLRALSYVFFYIDQWVVDGLVNMAGAAPKETARAIRPWQSGVLHGYALGMAGGVALLLVLVWMVMF